MRSSAFALLLASLLSATVAAAAERRSLTADDINALRDVGDPQVSPDGEWVAYTVRTTDPVKDKRITHLWMTSWDGSRSLQLTQSEHSESTPRWSPDGKYISFLTARGGDEEPEQVWLLDRTGGEASPLTGFNGDVIDYAWSPDGKRLALIVADEDPNKKKKGEEDKTPPSIVIDRYYFKEDETGYLGTQRQHLYVFDVATRQAEILTPGRYDEGWPSWSPDGRQLAFFSKRTGDPDRSNEFGLYVMSPEPGATPRLLTTFQGDSGDVSSMSPPSWRPDGRELAFVAAGDPKLIYYSTHHLAVVSSSGGEPRILTRALDRNVLSPVWARNGRSIYFLIEDDRNQHLARINTGNNEIERLVDGRRETSEFDIGGKDRIAVLDGIVEAPDAVYAFEEHRYRRLTHHNDEWLGLVKLGSTEEISYASKDGTRINGFIVKPPDYRPGHRYPTLLWLHGGPVSQYASSFSTPWQIFASAGYVVLGVNPRGSSGRGEAFSTAIYADWGNKDVEDVLGAVDYAVKQGVADPDRLGVGGWSYGGMLTNYVIAQDTRFKAATSGAGISNILAGYGTDQYIRDYEAELGRPWEHPETWMRVSFPFFHASRIVTPTLFLCGEKDFNVPLLNSEQMYQALRSLGVETQLVIYPGQHHGIVKPSYIKDRMQRYLDWYTRLIPVK